MRWSRSRAGDDTLVPRGRPASDGRHGDGDQRSQDQGCRPARRQDTQARAHGRRCDRDTELCGRQRAAAQRLSGEAGQPMAEHRSQPQQQTQKDQRGPGPERREFQ